MLTVTLDMNYVCAVYGVVVFILLMDWFIRGRHSYKGVQESQGEGVLLNQPHCH